MKRYVLVASFMAGAMVAAAAGALYAGSIDRDGAGAGLLAAAPASKTPLWTERTSPSGLSDDDPVRMSSFAKLAKEISPAVVFIQTNVGRGPDFDPFHPGARTGVGSGFIIHPDGLILTNNHVIDEAESIKVRTYDDREYDAEVLGRDEGVDIALLKIKGSAPFPVVPLGDSDKLDVGEWVVAIGNPYAYSHTVTAGIVSAKGRTDVAPGAPGHPSVSSGYYSFIQTDAAISPGSSGGPLINIHGEVIGVNTAINAAAEGIAFAVPINVIKKMVPELKAHGFFARSWLGIDIETLSGADVERYGLPGPHGAFIADVTDGSPAAKAGLKRGDVILSFNGESIRNKGDLRFLAAHHGIGREATLMVWREAKSVPVKVVLDALPSPLHAKDGSWKRKAPAASDEERVDSAMLGLRVDGVPRDVAAALGLAPGLGVFVLDVLPGPASGVIKPRDIILNMSDRPGKGTPVRGAETFYKKLAAIPDGAEVLFVIQRGEKKVFASIKKPRE